MVQFQALDFDPNLYTGPCGAIEPSLGRLIRVWDRQMWSDDLAEAHRPFVEAFRNIVVSPFVLLLAGVILSIGIFILISITEWYMMTNGIIRAARYCKVPVVIRLNTPANSFQPSHAQSNDPVSARLRSYMQSHQNSQNPLLPMDDDTKSIDGTTTPRAARRYKEERKSDELEKMELAMKQRRASSVEFVDKKDGLEMKFQKVSSDDSSIKGSNIRLLVRGNNEASSYEHIGLVSPAAKNDTDFHVNTPRRHNSSTDSKDSTPSVPDQPPSLFTFRRTAQRGDAGKITTPPRKGSNERRSARARSASPDRRGTSPSTPSALMQQRSNKPDLPLRRGRGRSRSSDIRSSRSVSPPKKQHSHGKSTSSTSSFLSIPTYSYTSKSNVTKDVTPVD
eukprot:CAMPEP_0185262688 /NCGR_PEP_ID=MMETSP1359-20130426/10763_1 /TAXON_ID=552665 /ORGANISM="Bigelowiella longifila, Strain CCMP242" /LENGTH=391 /DNA_ID=CAMNT_0027849707 /DNA_START=21 /DNA_END=1196 /DNA_ORIENTATION=+